jgi:hypothetical protein
MKKFIVITILALISIILLGCTKENNSTVVSKNVKIDAAKSSESISANNETIKKDTENNVSESETRIAEFSNEDEIKNFLKELQVNIKNNDKNKVANMIDYPFKTYNEGNVTIYKNANSIIEEWDKLFTDQVRNAILNQKYEGIFYNYQGVMIGSGEIWFNKTENGAKIIAINN